MGRLDLVGVAEQLGRLTEVVAGPEGEKVGLLHLLVLGEALRDPGLGALRRPGVHPRQHAQGKEVLRPLGVARLGPGRLGRLDGEARHRDLVDGERLEGPVGERIVGVPRLGEVALVEGVDVDDERAAGQEVVEVGLEGGRVHRHEDVGGIAGREDVVIGDVDLERADAGQRACRGPDLGGEVGQRRQVVAEQRAGAREPVTGELHAVTRVAREADDDLVQLL